MGPRHQHALKAPQGILRRIKGRGIRAVGGEQGGGNARGRGHSPIGSSQEQAQESHHIYAPGQGRGGQTPGTEPQESIPQNP